MHSLIDRWPSLLIVVVMTAALGACAGNAAQRDAAAANPPATGAQQAAAPADGGPVVNVVSKNFAFALDAQQAPAGRVTFVLTNDGPAPHDFAIRGSGIDRKTPVIERGKTASLTVDLQPGTYTFICAVPGHDQLGMTGTFTVV